MFVIRKVVDDALLFYVDRNITKRFWWSYDLKYALKFKSHYAAEKAANKLRYGTIKIMTYEEALELRKKVTESYHIEKESEDHPFSSEGLG